MINTRLRSSSGICNRLRVGVFAVITVTCGTAMAGDPRQSVALNIAAQPLSEALRELARQADVQIIFAPEVVAGRTASALRGNMSAVEALP